MSELKFLPKPYLVNAMWQNIVDNDMTPYATVVVDNRCQVPPEHVKSHKSVQADYIILNLGLTATDGLEMPKDKSHISFNTRFSGRVTRISFPYDCLVSLRSRELPDLDITFDYIPPSEQEPVSKKPTLSVVK